MIQKIVSNTMPTTLRAIHPKREIPMYLTLKITDVWGSDVARFAIKDTIEEYDRGVNWEEEEFIVKGDS